MGALLEAFAKTIELLFTLAVSGSERAYQKMKPYSRVYLKALAITAAAAVTVVPALALMKLLTGWVAFAYAAALVAVILTLILAFLWSPLGLVLGMLVEGTANPVIGGKHYLKAVAMVLFAELAISIILVRIPAHRNPQAIPLLLLAAAAVGLGNFIWGSWMPPKYYTFAPMAVLAVTIFSFIPDITDFFSEIDAQIFNIRVGEHVRLESIGSGPIKTYYLTPGEWRDMEIKRSFDYRSPGWLEFLYPNGTLIRLSPGEKKNWKASSTRFKIRGWGPYVEIIEVYGARDY